MKKLLFILIPPVIFGILVFLVFQFIIKGRTDKGALQVTSFPESKVYLNNAFIGHTPLCQCEESNMVKSGEYTIRLVPLDGKLTEFQDKIIITKSVLTVVDRKFGESATSEGSVISLLPLSDKKLTELLVLTVPDQSEVFLNNNLVGKTPLLLKDIASSDHTLRVKKTGYKDKTVRIHTAQGYKLTSTIYLGIADITPTPIPSPSATVSGTLTPVPTGRLTPAPSQSARSVIILETPNGFLRVRESASLSAAEVDRVNDGETYPLLSEDEGWYQIRLPSGETGWISSQFAEIE